MKSGTKARAGKSGKAQVKAVRSRRSKAKRNSPSGPVAREKADLDRTLHFVYGYRGLAEEAGNVGGKIRALAWEQVKAFPPIRIRSAQDLLQVSDHTIDVWCQRGILKLSGKRPKRVSLDSVLVAREALEEIRAAGQDRDLTSALLNKLELDELREDQRFRSSLAQAKRGERGDWPDGF
ncbi:MAG: hypothetical protein QOI84_506 [Solirubrobacterales bacterium]|jgi:hypothetical protein|nr:hypothetical protein [Solirubrobacterales bacterium]